MTEQQYPDGVQRLHNFYEQLLQDGASYYVLRDKEDYYFVTDSLQHEDNEGEPMPVMLFWSKDYIEDANIFIEDNELTPISLDDFFEELIPSLLENQVLLGINWSENSDCVELFAEEFLDILDESAEEVAENENNPQH